MLSIGSVAAEPADRLSNDQYWFVQAGDTTGTNYDGETQVRTLAAGDTVAYCTLGAYVAQDTKDPEEADSLDFNKLTNVDLSETKLGYFVKMKVKFGEPLAAPSLTSYGDFPYRTLFYVKNNKIAFLERAKDESGKFTANAAEVLTDVNISDDYEEIVVNVLRDNTFRVYIGKIDGENLIYEPITVDGRSKFDSLLQGELYAADMFNSFAFTGTMSFRSIEYTDVSPLGTYESVSFKIDYYSAAFKNVSVLAKNSNDETITLDADKTLHPGDKVTVSFELKDDEYIFTADPTLNGNGYENASISPTEVSFTVPESITSPNPLTLTLSTKAYYMTLDLEGGKTLKFSSVTNAIAKASEYKVPLVLKNPLELKGENYQVEVKEGQEVVLDLAGKKIKGLGNRPEAEDAAIKNLGKLKIIDSKGGGVVEAEGFVFSGGVDFNEGKDTLALQNNNSAALTTIKAGIFNGIVTNSFGRIQIDGGKFYNVFNQKAEDKFYLRTQPGISISAKFDKASIGDDNYWSGDAESADKIEFRVSEPSYAELSAKLLSAEDVNKGIRPIVEAPGFDSDSVTWQNEEDENIYVGSLTSFVYSVTFDAGKKAADPASITYSVDTESELPSLTSELWDFLGWYVEDKKVASLGKYATYEGTEGALPQGLIFGDLTLVAKWAPKEIFWTNATTPKRGGPSEANGLFHAAKNPSWALSLPAGKGFEAGDEVSLKSITLSTVNASPNNIDRLPERLKLDDEFVATRKSLSALADSGFKYFETNFGFRPKVVYTFDDDARPTLTVGDDYLLTFEGGSEILLRLIKTTNPDLMIIGNCSEEPVSDYQFYVPMYEIVGEPK